MNMNNDQDDSQEFWSSLFQSFADSDSKDDFYPEIRAPTMVMSTSMSIDVPAEPWKLLEAGHEEAGPKNAEAEVEGKNNDEIGEKSTGKAMDKGKGKGKEVAVIEETETLGKRARGNQSRNLNEKRRRTNIKTKVQTLKELIPINGKKDYVATLQSIVDSVRDMKFFVESYFYSFVPMGMGMDFPGPWSYPYLPPNFMMPYNHFAQGETSGHNKMQIVPFTPKEVDNQPQTSKPM